MSGNSPTSFKPRSAIRKRSSQWQRKRRRLGAGFERLEDRALLAAFSVNSLADTVDANPGDGMAVDAAGQSTLRAAIMEANALAGNDTINLGPNTYALVLTGANEDVARTGDLDLLSNGQLTITGAGAGVTIIDAGALDRVFHLHAGATVQIVGVTIRNGDVFAPSPNGSGGGILNSGALTINNSAVTGNKSGSLGGGIHNDLSGTLTITDSTISGNGGNATGTGGGIYNSGQLTIINSTIASNSASNFPGHGGGIYNSQSGTATIAGSTIRSNSVTALPNLRGGGIYNMGTLAVTNSAIIQNLASVRDPSSVTGGFSRGDGGGIYNESGTLSLTNTTISGNTSVGGGGVRNSGQMVIKNSTIANNTTVGGFFCLVVLAAFQIAAPRRFKTQS